MKRLGALCGITLMVFILCLGTVTEPHPGKQLALQHCGACHIFPKPDILTKKSWNYLLTDMGFRLGIIDYSYLQNSPPMALFHLSARQQVLNIGGLIPPNPMISEDDWQLIRDYYLDNAPASPLPQANKPSIETKLPDFSIQYPSHQVPGAVYTLTRVIDSVGGIILADQHNGTLTRISKDLKITEHESGHQLVVDMELNRQDIWLLSIGDLMGQHVGNPLGIIYSQQLKLGGSAPPRLLVSDLLRPADMELHDLNLDGNRELIISNFGDVTGDISIYRLSADGYQFQQTLIQAPGAIKTVAHDFNHDGLPDVAALLGDARENVSLFINLGNHQYERKMVVETLPSYGHTYFELQDFNNDGHMDLLVTNGDTDADPFNTLKNYHGVRIYLNNGENDFTLGYFYPMYGAHFAKAYDFDQDGDLDIAASAFFPDFSSNKPEQFTYLQNRGDMTFDAYTDPQTYQGRWMTLDIGDFDLDNDVDIVLGAGYLPLGMSVEYPEKLKQLQTYGKSLMVIENNLNP